MNETGQIKNKISYIFKVFLIAAILGTVFLMIFYYTMDEGHAVDKAYVEYLEDWTVIDSAGDSFDVKAPYRDDRIYDEDFTIVSTLPDKIPDGSYVCFIARCANKVYIGGELRKDFDQYRDMPLRGGTVKNFYMLTPVSEEDSGKEIRIFRGRVDRRNEIVPETFIAGRGGLYEVLMYKYGISFVASVMLLFVSTIVIIVGIGMRISYRHSISMLYAALGVCVTSLWLISNSYLYPFAFGHYHIDGVINYLSCMLLPFGFLLYIDSIQKGRYRRFFNIVLGISLISFVVWTVLHFMEVFSFPRALSYIDLIIAIDILVTFVLVVLDIKNGYAKEYKYTVIGFMLFFVFSIVEICIILFIPTKDESIPMLLGITALLGLVLWQQIKDLSRMTLERERAVQLSNAKTAFLANMSHEIRTPINSILGMNEMILMENKDNKIDEYARTVQSSGKMLLSLVNDVLDFSQLEADRMKIINSGCLLSSILADINAMSLERAAGKDVVFTTEIDGEIPDGISTDEVRLKQILINLINNAIKYTDEGNVTLSVGGRYISGDLYELRLSVKDTGRGIKDEDKEHLFDAFTRADIVRNRNIEGTGLGLAIVKRIVDAMEGRVTVESRYLYGSTFDVLLPVKVTDRTPVNPGLERTSARVEEDISDIDYRAPGANVLAVDDNKSNLDIVRMFLGKADIRPTLCRGGREAVEMSYDHKYDLILLDHMMPELDGIQALHLIRKEKDSMNKETPAVVLTANAIAGSEKMYLAVGFSDYLTKPIESVKLLRTVRKYLPKDKVLKKETNKEKKDNSRTMTGTGYGSETIKDTIKREETFVEDNSFIGKLRNIEGMDVDEALTNCGGDEGILEVVIGDIVSDSVERTAKMRELVKAGNYNDYGIEAHALKGLMATIGVKGLSERARKHEFAAKDSDHDFIDKDYEGLINEFADLCDKMK